MSQPEQKYDAIIIGGGLAGLTCALTLIRRGKKIILLERMHMVGGCQGSFKRGDFLFEPNIHSVAEAGENGIVNLTLASLGMKETPSFSQLHPNAHLIFPDESFDIPAELGEYLSSLRQKFPKEASAIDEIFKTMSDIYEGIVRYRGKAPIIGQHAGKVFQQLLDEFISDRRLQLIISGFWGWGFPPSRVSALLFSTLTYSLCAKGNYFPRRGISSLIKLLEKEISEGGGEIFLNSPVKEILIKNEKACGVLLESGEQIESTAIVSNIDAITTFFQMIGEQHLPTDFVSQLRTLEPALSCFNVLLGIKNGKMIPEDFATNNFVYPNYDFKVQYEAIMNGEIENAPYCITIPTKINPSLAPAGHHIITLYTPIAYRPKGIDDWNKKKDEYTARFIKMAGEVIPGLKQHIVELDTTTPDTLERFTGNSKGAIAGWNYTPFTDIARPQNKTPIDGLWLAGHWTLPGPGTHSAIPSGCITAAMIP